MYYFNKVAKHERNVVATSFLFPLEVADYPLPFYQFLPISTSQYVPVHILLFRHTYKNCLSPLNFDQAKTLKTEAIL